MQAQPQTDFEIASAALLVIKGLTDPAIPFLTKIERQGEAIRVTTTDEAVKLEALSPSTNDFCFKTVARRCTIAISTASGEGRSVEFHSACDETQEAAMIRGLKMLGYGLDVTLSLLEVEELQRIYNRIIEGLSRAQPPITFVMFYDGSHECSEDNHEQGGEAADA